jgi:hypothetical protein
MMMFTYACGPGMNINVNIAANEILIDTQYFFINSNDAIKNLPNNIKVI